MNQPKILIADDELSITKGLSAVLSDEGYDVVVAQDGKKALDHLGADSFGVVLADLMMPKLDGLALLKELQRLGIPTECIIVTGQGTVDSAVQAMREGAYDYIEKPLNAEKLNRLKALIPKALEKFNVQQRNRELSSKLEGLTHYGELTGQSEEMRGQVKLLRSIETRVIRRLGGKKEITVDIRVVAATNRDLQKALAENELREDLYYRLAVVEIFLPPLRDRAGDIKLLANEFLARFAQQNGKKLTAFDERAWEFILSHNWPGNVRELKNAVERAVIMTRSDKITAADIMPRHIRMAGETSPPMTVPEGASLADTKRQLVLRTFASTSGDAARTAKIVGISVDDVRAELASLIKTNGGMHVAEPATDDGSRPRSGAAKTKGKKR